MTEREHGEVIEDYLRRLATESDDMPASARQELIDDVRSHIGDAWENAPEHNRATLLNILERLGKPEDLAREGRERLGIEPARPQQDADVLSVAAIVFTAVFWPLGLLLSWISSRWSPGDKAIATMIPVLGLLLGLLTSMALFTTAVQVQVQQVSTSTQSDVQQRPESAHRPDQSEGIGRNLRALAGRTLPFYGFLGAPLTSAAYLTFRLRRRTRRWASLIPVVAGVLAGVMILMLFFTPMEVPTTGVRPAP